ncbi:hypothetical protein SRHO_G00221250 [Serrasalmus rhombeus]
MSPDPQSGPAPTVQSFPEAVGGSADPVAWERPSGFLDLLMTLKSSFSATTQQNRPRSSAIPSPGPESDAGLSGKHLYSGGVHVSTGSEVFFVVLDMLDRLWKRMIFAFGLMFAVKGLPVAI